MLVDDNLNFFSSYFSRKQALNFHTNSMKDQNQFSGKKKKKKKKKMLICRLLNLPTEQYSLRWSRRNVGDNLHESSKLVFREKMRNILSVCRLLNLPIE